jgi:hypothetical protein
MPLDSIIKELQALKPFVDEDVEQGRIETMTGRRGRKAQAIARTEELRGEYIRDLIRSAIFIITTGQKRDEFQAIATGEKFGLFSADSNYFFNDLAGRVSADLYNRAGDLELFDVLGRHLSDKMTDLGLTEYNQLIFKAKYIQPIHNAQDFANVLKVALTEQIGAEIVGVQAVNQIADVAISKGYSSQTTPIVLNTEDEGLALKLVQDLKRLTGRIFLVTVGKTGKELKGISDVISLKEATEESVKSTLDLIIKSLKR